MGLFSDLKQKIKQAQEGLAQSQQQFQSALYPKTVRIEDMIRKGSGFGGPTTVGPSGESIDLISQIGEIFKRSNLSDSTITISSFGKDSPIMPLAGGKPVNLSTVAAQTLILFPNESKFKELARAESSGGFYQEGGISANLHELAGVVDSSDLSGQATDLIAINPTQFKEDLPMPVMRRSCSLSSNNCFFRARNNSCHNTDRRI